ncbi:MAG: SDR family NAD(P)-dependent oxidoreductase [Bdellovibrionota bacterium]
MFTDKNAVITGASSGLGRALAVALSHKGANILLAGRDEHALVQTKALCVGDGDISIFVGDITAPEDTQRLLTAATASKNLDMLFLNAGMSMWSEFKDLPDIDVFRQMMEVNFFANVDLLHKALPFLLQSRGHVVAISSFQGKIGVPYHTAYAASKHALVGWIDSLRLEVEPQVQFLSVFPSWLKGTNLRSNSFVELGNKKCSTNLTKGPMSISVVKKFSAP